MCNENNMCDENNNVKSCIPFETIIEVNSLARAYVPFQKFCSMYNGEKGLVRGTVFPELYRTYCKKNKKSCKKCE